MKRSQKKPMRRASVMVTNSFGVIGYIVALLAYVLMLSTIAALVMVAFSGDGSSVTPRAQDVEPIMAAANEPYAVLSVVFALIAVAVVMGALAWVVFRMPPALLRYISRTAHALAYQIQPKGSARTFLCAQLLLISIPGVVMLVLYAFLWTSSVMLPLLILTGFIIAVAVVGVLVQAGCAKVLRVKSELLF